MAIPDNLHSLSSYHVLIAGWQVSKYSFDQTLTRLKYILPKIHFSRKNTLKREKTTTNKLAWNQAKINMDLTKSNNTFEMKPHGS